MACRPWLAVGARVTSLTQNQHAHGVGGLRMCTEGCAQALAEKPTCACSEVQTCRAARGWVAEPAWLDEAFMSGKLKIKGNIMLAQKLGTILEAAK